MAIQDKTKPNGYTHIGKTALKQRGWTDSLIAKHLPDPEKFVFNLNYRSGPKRGLWSWETVLEIEAQIQPLIDKVLGKREAHKQSDAAYFHQAAKTCRYKKQVKYLK